MNTEKKVIIGSAVAFVVLIVLAIVFSNELVLTSNLVLLSIIIVTVPFSAYKFINLHRIREYEKEFPAFLRDLAESQRAGLTIIQSIHIAAKSDYGSLTKEIRRIDNQLSWNVSLDKALKSFSDKADKSKIIVRAIMVIRQANQSGGRMAETMESLANNIEMLRDVQAEKASLLNQQVMMMYAIFFIFLGISIALVKFLTPLLQTQSNFELIKTSSPNPCSICTQSADPGCLGCSAFFAVSATFGFGEPSDPTSYYRSIFFTMIVVQGFFTGLIAGQIASDSVIAGLKHSLVMLLAGIFVFVGVAKLGVI